MESTGIFTTLEVNPIGQESITFYFFIVELPEGNTLSFSAPSFTPAEGESAAIVSYTADYGNHPPSENSETTAYMLPFVQQFENPAEQDQRINLSGATLEVYQSGESNPKVKGTIQGIKTTKRPVKHDRASDFVDETPQMNELRYCIAEYHLSTDNSAKYFVVAMSKTDKEEHANSLEIKVKSGQTDELEADFQAQSNSTHNSGYVCAIGCLASSKNQFKKIEIKGVGSSAINLKYDSAHIVQCSASEATAKV